MRLSSLLFPESASEGFSFRRSSSGCVHRAPPDPGQVQEQGGNISKSTENRWFSTFETGQMSSVGTGQMSAAETGQRSAVETGQMSAVETGQMTAAETSVLSQQKTSDLSQQCPRLLLATAGCHGPKS